MFVNRIAGLLHTIVYRWGGVTNKNIGEAFLLVWRLWPPIRVKHEKRKGRRKGSSSGARSPSASWGARVKRARSNSLVNMSRESMRDALGELNAGGSSPPSSPASSIASGIGDSRRGSADSSVAGTSRRGSWESGGAASPGAQLRTLQDGISSVSTIPTVPAGGSAKPSFSVRPPAAGTPRLGGQINLKDIKKSGIIATQALIAIVRINSMIINTPDDLMADDIKQKLQEVIPGFRVEMGFGLHAGWAIEGAVGSTHKIDATYLAPDVNLAARVHTATKQYGVAVMFTGEVWNLLSASVRDECRRVDVVNVKGSVQPLSLHTFDQSLRNRRRKERLGLVDPKRDATSSVS